MNDPLPSGRAEARAGVDSSQCHETKWLVQGLRVYENACAGCHGRNGQGDPSGFFPALPGSSYLTNPDPQPLIDALTNTDYHSMVAGTYPKDLLRVASYLRFAYGGHASTVCPGQVEVMIDRGR